MMWLSILSAVPYRWANTTWEMFNGCVANTSLQLLSGDFSGGWNAKWRTSFASGGSYENYAQFLIGDINGDALNEVVGAYSSYIVAMRGTDGFILWSFSRSYTQGMPSPAMADLDGDGISEIVVDDDALGTNQVVALRGNTGAVFWRTDVSGAMYSSPYDL